MHAHKGGIENERSLREELQAEGVFKSETDIDVIPYLPEGEGAADTLAALAMEQERRRGVADPAFAPRLLGITNRPESSVGRLVDQNSDI